MMAYLFPGQSSQYVGMGREVLKYKEAEAIFSESCDTLGYDVKELCLEGPLDRLSLTEYSQIAILTVSIAYLRVLPYLFDGNPSYCGGHSLGEYSALVACSSLSFNQGLQIVQKRANLMKEAALRNPSGMSAILGLQIEMIEGIAKESGCEIANINSVNQIVISGRLEALSVAEALTKGRGGKAIRLKTSGGFHSSLMAEVEIGMAEVLKNEEIKPPRLKFIPNILAEPVETGDVIRDCLIRQVTNRVRWEETMRFLEKEGVERVIEIGPGNILTNLAKKMGLSAISFEEMIK
jgi:[acyl-carrier-protein] S-malonyltransferase